MSKGSKESSMENFFNSNEDNTKGHEAISKGEISRKKYSNYYDISNTITTAGASDPNDFDSTVYNRERIYVTTERNAEKLNVKNDGSDTLFIVISHGNELAMTREVPLYPGEVKVYFNVYEIRLRCATIGNAYRVTEYDLCCNNTSSNSTIVPATVSMIKGTKTAIDNVASQITSTSTPIYKVVIIRVRSFDAAASYISIGDSTSQPFRLTSVGASINIDFTDNLNKIYCVANAGNTSVLEFIGG